MVATSEAMEEPPGKVATELVAAAEMASCGARGNASLVVVAEIAALVDQVASVARLSSSYLSTKYQVVVADSGALQDPQAW